MQPQQLRSADGVAIAARFFAPADGTPLRSAVLIGGAMGVRQGYYEPFARLLATQGHLVATFDYRGMGDSRSAAHARSLRGFDADLFDWARDYDTAIDALREANLANPSVHVEDGVEALEYLERRGRFADRSDEEPAVLLLDEPVAHLDHPTASKVLAELHAATEERTLALVTHQDLGEEGCSRVLRWNLERSGPAGAVPTHERTVV